LQRFLQLRKLSRTARKRFRRLYVVQACCRD